jgi:uncharacterized membrane protein
VPKASNALFSYTYFISTFGRFRESLGTSNLKKKSCGNEVLNSHVTNFGQLMIVVFLVYTNRVINRSFSLMPGVCS